MPRSRPTATADARWTISANVLGLCWGAWTELGVSAWGRSHEGWAIDPEPLIVFTAHLGDREPRLRDEATDWCIRNWRLISRVRLRNLVRRESAEHQARWGSFAATVNAHAGVDWPGAGTAREAYRVTGRSTLRPLTEPSMALLRLRSIFGLGTRAEVLRYRLFHARSTWVTAQALADATNYGKRNVAEAADALVQAGVLRLRAEANRNTFALAEPEKLAAFVGAPPSFAPEWAPLLMVLGTVLHLAERSVALSAEVEAVETRGALRQIEALLDALGITPPPEVRGAVFVREWNRWAVALTGSLATGEWPGGPRGR